MTLLVLRMVEERFHRDTEDRPIREGRTPPEFLRAGEIEYKTCPYSGSRHLHANPMNVSALRQTSGHWDEFIDTLAFLRSIYEDARGAGAADLHDMWRVSQLGSALPWFFILRGERVPAYASALAKATLGMGIWAHRGIVRTFAEPWAPPTWTSQLILEAAEANGTLIGETEVCSAGDKMLLKFFDVLVTRQPFTGAGEVAQLATLRDDVLRFGAHYIAFKQIIWVYFLARRFLYADILSARGETPELRELLDAWCEPPDCFTVEPTSIAQLSADSRVAWFRKLAACHVPLTAEDRGYTVVFERFVDAIGARGDDPITRAVATFGKLDEIFGDAVAITESGFRGAPNTDPIDAATRDRLVAMPPRNLFAHLAATNANAS